MLVKIKQLLLLMGDIVLLYGALALTLLIRYQGKGFGSYFRDHVAPFSLIFVIWILILYLQDLYRAKSLTFNPQTIQTFFTAVGISAGISLILFYLFGGIFSLTPKTNLVVFSALFGIIGIFWRWALSRLSIAQGLRSRVLFVGDSPVMSELAHYFVAHPHVGYDVAGQLKVLEPGLFEQEIKRLISGERVDTVIIQPQLIKDPALTKVIYQLLPLNVLITDAVSFYELIFQKIPLKEIEERWFIEKLLVRRRFYDTFKRSVDLILGTLLFVVLLPIMLLVWIAVKITSRGPAVYRQERIGLSDKPFILNKFRTMRHENGGPLWTEKRDSRLTPLGRFLRFTHLDELPQLYNVVVGDISFVGPRPERRELVEQYRQLPYYEMRHIIKPGLTGWAQVNFGPSASLEEAREKLEYDLYYIKNRSLGLDFLIILRTVKMFLFNY